MNTAIKYLDRLGMRNRSLAKRWRLYETAALIVLSVLSGQILYGAPVAFPGAEGFGAYAQGGRGGDVYTVTNINDSGPGSLREGIRSAAGPRTIVFAVSGLVKLKSTLVVDKHYITIAGQTAPGDGICLRDYPIEVAADHVIMRYIRSRLGAESGKGLDAISISKGRNVILDHCSASWSVDEGLSCSTDERDRINNVTVQWCIISEALNSSAHTKGKHSYGALIRGCYGAKYTYHHNLFAHNYSRNPRPGNYDRNPVTEDPLGLLFDFRNNVLYNWGGERPGYDADTESATRMNFVGNYAKHGPNSRPGGHLYNPGSKHFRAYFSENYFDGRIPANPYSLIGWGGWSASEQNAWKQSLPYETGPIVTDTAQDAYRKVLRGAGASYARDSVDSRVIQSVIDGAGAVINDVAEVGAWPAYRSAGAPLDGDRDGMADGWERVNGLSSKKSSDRNGYDLSSEYTNLEMYLNGIVDGLTM